MPKTLVKCRCPNATAQQQAEQHSGRTNVFGALGQVMPFGADAVNGAFNTGVEQFRDHDKNHARAQQRHFHPRAP